MATTKYTCLSCGKKSTRKAAKLWNFFPSTRLCRDCYEKGRGEDHRKWCFGKLDNEVARTWAATDQKRTAPSAARFGYDPERFECGTICPDRLICPLFIIKPYKVKGKRVNASKISIFRSLKREQGV